MYKNLCTDGLGMSVRQNEMIEIALTYGYRGIEIDMDDMTGRAESMGKPFATQFINSASVEVGTFCLPIDFNQDDDGFEKQMAKMEIICDLAKTVEAKLCYINIVPEHDSLPFHENFEKHRERISKVADQLAESGVRVGLKLNTDASSRDTMKFIQKADEVLTLVKTISHDNVGLVLDAWHWTSSQSSIDTIKAIDPKLIFEVRLADPAENAAAGEEKLRRNPGTHPHSLCSDLIGWLKEIDFDGPIALNAAIEKSGGNTGVSLFQRVSKVFDGMLTGETSAEAEEPTDEAADEEPVAAASN